MISSVIITLNSQVDASNAGFDWYYMGGSGTNTYTAGGLYDGMLREKERKERRRGMCLVNY